MFLLNHIIVRLTKIMNNLAKDLYILIFKVLFQCRKLIESFQKKSLLRRPTQITELKKNPMNSKVCTLFLTFAHFFGSVHSFGSRQDKNKCLFLSVVKVVHTFVSMASLKFRSLTDSTVSLFPLGKCHSSYLVRERQKQKGCNTTNYTIYILGQSALKGSRILSCFQFLQMTNKKMSFSALASYQ